MGAGASLEVSFALCLLTVPFSLTIYKSKNGKLKIGQVVLTDLLSGARLTATASGIWPFGK
jgi:hypothetical protein